MADLIDRQAALKKLAVYIHLIDKTMGKGTLTDDDCMEAAKSVLGEDELPAVQPATSCSEIPNGSDDTISRQAAIDALARMMPRSYTPDGSHPADEEIFMAQEIYADCIEALEILPSAQPEQRWIPCRERMPEEGQKCLVYDKAIGFRVDTYIGHGNPYNWELFVRDYEAWMPLPDPYTEEKKE